MPSVNVLLSTYRGGSYIAEQLASLQAQEAVEVSLTFHMDEIDDAVENQIRAAFPGATKVALPPGLGLPRSYLELLQRAQVDADYWAFADQDDFWLPAKLQTASAALRGVREPCLWIGTAEVFGDGIRGHSREFFPSPSDTPSFANALVETIAPGCAMVWNRALQELLRTNPNSNRVRMHDAWVYLVATALGRVVIERSVTVSYRQHAGNAVGIQSGWIARGRRLIRKANAHEAGIQEQALEFGRQYGRALSIEQRQVVDALAGSHFWPIVRIWARGKIRRQRAIDNLALVAWLMIQRVSKSEEGGGL